MQRGTNRCQAKDCQWGLLHTVCGNPAVTKRQRLASRLASGATWDLCQPHADSLDRLRERVRKDRPLLDRLAAG